MARETEGYREALEQVLEAFPGKKMLTVEEVAEFLGCDRRTVTALIGRGRLPGVNVGIGKYKIYRVSVKDLAKFRGGKER